MEEETGAEAVYNEKKITAGTPWISIVSEKGCFSSDEAGEEEVTFVVQFKTKVPIRKVIGNLVSASTGVSYDMPIFRIESLKEKVWSDI